MTRNNAYHTPVLANAAIEALSIKSDGVFVDATFGGGGHSGLILQKIKEGKLVAFDQDQDAESNLQPDSRIVFFNHNFRFMKNFLKLYGFIPVDGILADLGVSSHQFDVAERGFSTRFEGPLDMRMDKNSRTNAADVVNDYEIDKLISVFRNLGELKNARAISRTIEEKRAELRIETTAQLKDILIKHSERGKESKFLAKIFQALRIEVNNELESLKEFLRQSAEVLRPGGRLVVISYHSLEDRLVKNYMRSGNFDGVIQKDFFGNPIRPLVPVGKKILPDKIEIEENSRARSAVMRVAEKQE